MFYVMLRCLSGQIHAALQRVKVYYTLGNFVSQSFGQRYCKILFGQSIITTLSSGEPGSAVDNYLKHFIRTPGGNEVDAHQSCSKSCPVFHNHYSTCQRRWTSTQSPPGSCVGSQRVLQHCFAAQWQSHLRNLKDLCQGAMKVIESNMSFHESIPSSVYGHCAFLTTHWGAVYTSGYF